MVPVPQDRSKGWITRLVGSSGMRPAAVSSSFATGAVVADGGYAGGLVGYASANVFENTYANRCGHKIPMGVAGGLVGVQDNNNAILTSYAVGPVSGTITGGLIGAIGPGGGQLVPSQSYWDVQTTGQTQSAGGIGTGSTDALMKQEV